MLAPRGWAYIGGGFGSKDLLESIEITMRSFNNGTDHFKNRVRRNLNRATHDRFKRCPGNRGHRVGICFTERRYRYVGRHEKVSDV